MNTRRLPAGLSLLSALLLAACASPPAYQPPVSPVHEDRWQGDQSWQPARPADEQARGPWWTVFGDAALSELESRIETGSDDLAVALARLRQARAFELQARAAQAPSLDAGVSLTRNRQSDDRPLRGSNQPDIYDANTAGLAMGYELDLWGRISSLVAASQASGQAAQADLASVRLSLQARLAEQYLSLRSADAEIHLLDDAVQTYRRALSLTENRHRGGIASGIDVERARTQLAGALVARAELQARRAAYEHAIAALVGVPPQEFKLAASEQDLAPPSIPMLLPSQLLQRRPDIAAAERRVASATARIGVAKAAFFPVIGIGPSFGYQNTGGAGWLSAPDSFWSIGPQLSFNVFDGGLRRAQLVQARAALDEATAAYRSTVLHAFEQVQDELSRQASLKTSIGEAETGVEAADKAMAMVLSRYREGAVSYIEVVSTQTAALDAQRKLLLLRSERLQSGVNLIRALGGGWQGGENDKDGEAKMADKQS